ncbi:MAG: hypothetical protein Ct9H90mP23_2300 [Methanobacteriota archaeon]|nr:MAG: hypothetical protein Ct9H90mP23_2300 [Euryarchaeota archaeon]
MGKISAVDLFSSWAEMGKDEGMETGHAPSVEFMISKSIPKQKVNFRNDIGCGNGWLVRKLNTFDNCFSVQESMVQNQ